MKYMSIKFEASDEQTKELEERIFHLCSDIGIKLKRTEMDYGDNFVVDCSYE